MYYVLYCCYVLHVKVLYMYVHLFLYKCFKSCSEIIFSLIVLYYPKIKQELRRDILVVFYVIINVR